MKKVLSCFATLWLLAAMITAFVSCQKENGLTPQSSKLSRPEMQVPFYLSSQSLSGGRFEGNDCNCEYQIVEVNATPPPGHHLEYSLYAEESCVQNINCQYFTLKQGPCDYFLTCFDEIPSNPTLPTQWFPFECIVPGYSTITSVNNMALYMINGGCSSTGLPEGNVKIRIRCTDSPPLNCEKGPGLTHVSEIITVNLNDLSGTPVTLTGCGCAFPF